MFFSVSSRSSPGGSVIAHWVAVAMAWSWQDTDSAQMCGLRMVVGQLWDRHHLKPLLELLHHPYFAHLHRYFCASANWAAISSNPSGAYTSLSWLNWQFGGNKIFVAHWTIRSDVPLQ
jgi:hypothetical protein